MLRYIGLVLVAMVVFMLVMGGLRQVAGPGVTSLIWLGLLVVGVVILVRNLGSNRKVADAPPEMRAAALTFAPEHGKAALYVLRTQFLGKAVGVNVQVDGRDVAQIKSPRFTRILLAPGARRVAGYTGTAKQPQEGSGVSVNASAGEIIVLMCAVEPQMIGSVVKFTPTPLEKARAEIAKARMVAPDVAEV